MKTRTLVGIVAVVLSALVGLGCIGETGTPMPEPTEAANDGGAGDSGSLWPTCLAPEWACCVVLAPDAATYETAYHHLVCGCSEPGLCKFVGQ